MTPDDEAFVRAIVDRPGDDLPRLVYADWLDERGDPRGPYLRAEAAAPGDAARLTPLAAGLDPVWVARVSRPSVGVCCDHVRWDMQGTRLTSSDLDAAERRLDGRFSPDFRAFALNYNGGEPNPAWLPDPLHEAHGPLCLQLGQFFAVSRASELSGTDPFGSWSLDVEFQRQWLEELYTTGGGLGPNPHIKGLVPFADTLHDLGSLLLRVEGEGVGKVYHFSDYCHHARNPEYLTVFAASFAELLSRIGPDLED